MDIKENVLETIGNTPLVKLNNVLPGIKATVVAKVETTNPGNSIKDRMALQMIEDAEADGRLKPGGTIIEGTSGNTGMGLAIAAAVKGYKCIFTTTDKQSKEKVDILKAMGAEVIVCPTSVAADDPRSYYSVAAKLNKEIPNSFYPNQYDNLSNRKAHYEQTGPEIWGQTDGKVTHLVVGVGTGGTISGTGRYLKEQNPDVQVLGIDTYGSVFKKYHETGEFDENEIYPYITEGIGEDILPENVDFKIIDHFEKVTDKDGLLMTRELAVKEGIFVGNSAGSAVQGVKQMAERFKEGDLVVIIMHDHGSRYVGKIFNDDWMHERGFLSESQVKVMDIIQRKEEAGLKSIESNKTIKQALETMSDFNFSYMPVLSESGEIVGSISEKRLYKELMENKETQHLSVENVMEAPLAVVTPETDYNQVASIIDQKRDAVVVDLGNGQYDIITKYDIIQSLTK